jgi:hypothetical protein
MYGMSKERLGLIGGVAKKVIRHVGTERHTIRVVTRRISLSVVHGVCGSRIKRVVLNGLQCIEELCMAV